MDGNNNPKNIHPAARKYFQSVEELTGDTSAAAVRDVEFGVPTAGDELGRRDFMKLVGTTFAAASVTTGCARRPVEKVIPYVNKPEEVTPGVAAWYATVCGSCDAGCGLLMKARDGRPVKVEGNGGNPINEGGVCARGQGSVIDLYDGDRIKKSEVGGKAVAFGEFLKSAAVALKAYDGNGAGLAVVTRPVSGPGTLAAIDAFTAKYKGARHVVFEPVSSGAITAAHAATHGNNAIPNYDFSKADAIVAFGADFLGSWIAPVRFAAQWSKNRRIDASKKSMSTHWQVETRLSSTGASADKRIKILPSEQRGMIFALAAAVAGDKVKVTGNAGKNAAHVTAIAKLLQANKGKSLVVSDSTDVAVQAAVNAINEALGNYGKTLDITNPFGGRRQDDAAVAKLLADVQSGGVTGLILADVNPAYASADGKKWAAAIGKAKVSIALSQRKDETASVAKMIGATTHFLESWGDAEHVPGTVSIRQPLVRPMFDNKQWEETLLGLAGIGSPMRVHVQETWNKAVFPRAKSQDGGFLKFWDKAVHDGSATVQAGTFGEVEVETANAEWDAWKKQSDAIAGDKAKLETLTGRKQRKERSALEEAIAKATAALKPEPARTQKRVEKKITAPTAASWNADGAAKAVAGAAAKTGAGKYELVLYTKNGVGPDGSNNPFLHELPGSLSRVAWDNYACISPKTAQALGVANGDHVAVKAGGASLDLPVVLSPGLPDGAVAVALGYGRTKVGRIGNGVGQDAWPASTSGKADVSKAGASEKLAFLQLHPSAEHRDIVRETTLAAWQKDQAAGNITLHKALRRDNKQDKPSVEATPIEGKSVWGDRHDYSKDYKWHMVIDPNACTGCGACVVSCSLENNVPMVGKTEVATYRDMHWLRIDRYYAEKAENQPPEGGYDWDPTQPDLLAIADNPDVIFQPVMCQHCENAPCENVCPVLATVHTSEGLNAMAYNRCIGTRYCANNCPYKVRRFNWFNYPEDTEMYGKRDADMVRLALNPDIVKRSRGVMEKCSMCVQRIQGGKSDAIRAGKERIWDGLVQSACSQSCPTQAITFGNVNDKKSAVRKKWDDPRRYRLVEEIGTRPSIGYLVKVRNRDEAAPPAAAKPKAPAGHGEKKEG